MRKIACLFLLGFSLYGSAQPAFDCVKNEEFQLKMQKFRYTLYADLSPQKDSLMYHFEDFFSDTTNVIYRKAHQFFLDNQKDIKACQLYNLQYYTHINIDLSKCTPDTTFNAIIKDSLSWAWFSKAYGSYVFLNYNPISSVFTCNTLLLSRMKTASEMGNTALLNNFTSPLVKTKLLHDEVWEIMTDTWQYIFVYEFNLSNNTFRAVKVLKRALE